MRDFGIWEFRDLGIGDLKSAFFFLQFLNPQIPKSLNSIKKAGPHYSNASAIFKENSSLAVPAMPQGHINLYRYQGVNVFPDFRLAFKLLSDARQSYKPGTQKY